MKEKRVSRLSTLNVECVLSHMLGTYTRNDISEYVLHYQAGINSKHVTFHTHRTQTIGKFDTVLSLLDIYILHSNHC